MKEFNYSRGQELVNQTAEYLQTVLPEMEDVKIDLGMDEKGKYRAQVKVFLKGKRFTATKINDTLYGSLMKTRQAVLKQLEKFNRKDKKVRYHKYGLAL